ncbi:tyrosine-type recombinase/integrase [Geotalea sp. SG265]|uniref:tyrosine-type recombinase/integrase n=1 Tax=Geotalea sp. SG265 TaxID=2922867 RepID=UPI001FAF99C5|nr:tyrosine-type recombinase/integrase [Geotalea sp. SG265]
MESEKVVDIKNRNHPVKGSSTKVEPIKKEKDIKNIKKLLSGNPRDFAIFTVGINTNLRGVDLLKLTVGKVRHMEIGDDFTLKEQKTSKKRMVTMNPTVYQAVQGLLATMPGAEDADYLFQSREGKGKPITTPYLNNLVKKWCAEINMKGNYGAHSLRKTWGYHQRVTFGVDIPTLMVMFNHSSQRQTLDYLCIQDTEIKQAYLNEL